MTQSRALSVGDIKWTVLPTALEGIRQYKRVVGGKYDEYKRDLQEYLCGYFNSTANCATSTRSIKPLGGEGSSGKILKVRWMYPQAGKSGGIRIAFVVHCDTRRVYLANLDFRKNAPDNDFFSDAVDGT